MADTKISALPSASLPLAGTEVLPIVQSSATKQVSFNGVFAQPPALGSTTAAAVSATALSYSTTLTGGTGIVNLGSGQFYKNASGFVGIGTTTPDAPLTLNGASSSRINMRAANTRYATVYADSGVVALATITSIPLVFGINDVEKGRFDTSDNFKIGSGNLIIGTSGKGIDFSATSGSGTSELLADYEEGTFTPVVVGSSTAGTGTYSLQSGLYTKVGRQVNVSLVLAWSAHTGTGTMSVTGLPFTNTATVASIPSLIAFNLTLTALNTLVGRINTSATSIEILQAPVGGGAWGGVAIDTNVDALIISASYIV